MPAAAPRICTRPGCGAIAEANSSRCAAHHVKAWEQRANATPRIRGRKLQRLRAELFERSPLCVQCEANGIVRSATQRDHVVNLASGGADDSSNVQALCDACHAAKTQTEAAKARGGHG